MKRRAWHRTRVLLMALLLGVGMSLSPVQASAMAAKMAIAAEICVYTNTNVVIESLESA